MSGSFFDPVSHPLPREKNSADAVDVIAGAQSKKMSKPAAVSYAEGVLRGILQFGGFAITLSDERYPPRLREIPYPPKILYCRGRIPDWEGVLAIGIVGQRKITPRGRILTEKIAYNLSAAGTMIISGLAAGADTAAHRGCIRAEGFTVAVLGTAIDVCFPSENNGLMRLIEQSGLVLSEYPPGAAGSAKHFPARNRIIAGLSRGLLVTEGRVKSGSLITAKFAIEFDRDIFAIPGTPGDESCEGTNHLIKQGAKMVESAEEILSEYEIHPKSAKKSSEQAEDTSDQTLIELVREYGTVERIFENSELPLPELLGKLTMLEIFGHIIKKSDTEYACMKYEDK